MPDKEDGGTPDVEEPGPHEPSGPAPDDALDIAPDVALAAQTRRGRHGVPRRVRRSRWRRWTRNRVVIGVAVAVVLLGAAGLALGLTGGSHPTAAKGPRPTLAPTTTVPQAPCPLTGAPPPSGPPPNRPALAVKVDNFPAARPQSGLDYADVVFEEPVEGGITRYVAVFQCQNAPLVGPIRSAREPDVAIVDELNDPIFVHVGGIDPIQALIRAADDDDYDLFYEGAIIQHPAGRVAPYDTYISTAAAWAANASDTSVPKPLFTYSAQAPLGLSVHSVHVPFSSSSDESWTWNATTKRFDLSYSGVPSFNADGTPVSAVNVVIMHVQTTIGPWLENDVGGYEVQVNPTSGGPLQVLRNGLVITGTWQRSSESTPAQLLNTSGTPIALAPGPTWIDLVPSGVAVTTS